MPIIESVTLGLDYANWTQLGPALEAEGCQSLTTNEITTGRGYSQNTICHIISSRQRMNNCGWVAKTELTCLPESDWTIIWCLKHFLWFLADWPMVMLFSSSGTFLQALSTSLSLVFTILSFFFNFFYWFFSFLVSVSFISALIFMIYFLLLTLGFACSFSGSFRYKVRLMRFFLFLLMR